MIEDKDNGDVFAVGRETGKAVIGSIPRCRASDEPCKTVDITGEVL